MLDRMRKPLKTRTGPKILRRTFLSNTFKAAAFELSQGLCTIKKHIKHKRLVDYYFCCTKEISATKLPIETIVEPVSKDDIALDLENDIIFDCNGGVKINKFLDYIESIVIGHNLRFTMMQVYTCR